MNDNQKAADAEALVRTYASWRTKALFRLLPPKYRRQAYLVCWNRLHATREAVRRLETTDG